MAAEPSSEKIRGVEQADRAEFEKWEISRKHGWKPENFVRNPGEGYAYTQLDDDLLVWQASRLAAYERAIQKLHKLRRFTFDNEYDMVTIEEDKEGQYMLFEEVEEILRNEKDRT